MQFPTARSRPRHLNEKTFAALDLLRAISDELGASMAAVALAWVRQQPEVTRPQLEFPAELLKDIAPFYQQAGATINGVESSEFRRDDTDG